MIFIVVIVSLKYFDQGSSLPLQAIAIGATLAFCAKSVSTISGGCLNPAVGAAQFVANHFLQPEVFKYGFNIQENQKVGRIFSLGTNYHGANQVNAWWPPLVVYTAGPLVGGLLAGYFTHMNRSIIEEKFEEDLEAEAGLLKGDDQ